MITKLIYDYHLTSGKQEIRFMLSTGRKIIHSPSKTPTHIVINRLKDDLQKTIKNNEKVFSTIYIHNWKKCRNLNTVELIELIQILENIKL